MFEFIAKLMDTRAGVILFFGYGAFLRWVFTLFKKPFRFYYKNEDGITTAYSIMGIITTLIVVIAWYVIIHAHTLFSYDV